MSVRRIYDIDGRYFGTVNEVGEIFDHNGKYRARVDFARPRGPDHAAIEKNGITFAEVYLVTREDGTKWASVEPDFIELHPDGSIWRWVGVPPDRGSVQQIGWMEPVPDNLLLYGSAVYLLTHDHPFFSDDEYKSPPPRWMELDPRYFRLP